MDIFSDIEENLPTSDLVPEDTTTTNYAEYENENVHIIYPAVNLTREEGSNSLAAIDSVQNLDDGNSAAADETPTDYQSTLSDDTHFILDSTTATEHTYLRSTITNSDQDENFVEEGTEQAVFQGKNQNHYFIFNNRSIYRVSQKKFPSMRRLPFTINGHFFWDTWHNIGGQGRELCDYF